MATSPFLPDETKPGASDLISLYPAVEQTFRDVIESWLLTEHNTDGGHKQVTLDDISEPTIAATLVGIWHESGVLKTRFAAGTVFDLLTTDTGMPVAGGTMTGDLVLAGAPDADLKAATKLYVDDADALKADLASPALTGNPTAPTQTVGNDSTRIATTAFVQAAGGAFEGALYHLQDQKSSGTGGGTFTSGAWRTRTLNTELTTEISGASVTSNVITLPTGTYYFEAASVAGIVNTNQLRLQNTAASTTVVVGLSVESPVGGDSGGSVAFVSGRFTITAEKTFELQHRCQDSASGNGFGQPAGFGVSEVFSDIKIWKVG